MISSLWSSLLNNHSAVLTLSTLCCGSRHLYCSQLGWKHDLKAWHKATPKFSLDEKSGRQDQPSSICCFVWALQICEICICMWHRSYHFLENWGIFFPQEMKRNNVEGNHLAAAFQISFRWHLHFCIVRSPMSLFPKTHLVWLLLNLHSAVTAWLV